MTNYIVATTKDWNIDAFHQHHAALPGTWHLITDPTDLTAETVARISPRYIFFPHWSWLVKPDILDQVECVCFHAADVPYGRGGSPIQNLIVRGHTETKLTALRMVEELDSGPIYLKRPLSLKGRGQDIFNNIAHIIWDLIAEIIQNEPTPRQQSGEAVVFARRTPEQSLLPQEGTLTDLFNHIRMLDVDTYPVAILKHGSYQIEFRHANMNADTVTAQVTIRHTPNE